MLASCLKRAGVSVLRSSWTLHAARALQASMYCAALDCWGGLGQCCCCCASCAQARVTQTCLLLGAVLLLPLLQLIRICHVAKHCWVLLLGSLVLLWLLQLRCCCPGSGLVFVLWSRKLSAAARFNLNYYLPVDRVGLHCSYVLCCTVQTLGVVGGKHCQGAATVRESVIDDVGVDGKLVI